MKNRILSKAIFFTLSFSFMCIALYGQEHIEPDNAAIRSIDNDGASPIMIDNEAVLYDCQWFIAGKEQAEAGNIEEAITSFEKAREQFEGDPQLCYYLGLTYCRAGKYEQGAQLLEDAYDAIGDDMLLEPIKNAYFLKGLQLAQQEQYTEARNSFDRVLSIDPKHGEAYYNRGVTYSLETDYHHALEDFMRAESYGFLSESLLLHTAVAYEKTGSPDKAQQIYDRIVHEYPYCAPAHFNLATMLETHFMETGEYDKGAADALYHYKRALELDESLYMAAFNLSRLYFKRDNPSMAIKWMKKCIELRDDLPQAYIALARMYIQKEAYNNALLQLEILEEKGYTLPDIESLKLEIYNKTGQSEPENK